MEIFRARGLPCQCHIASGWPQVQKQGFQGIMQSVASPVPDIPLAFIGSSFYKIDPTAILSFQK